MFYVDERLAPDSAVNREAWVLYRTGSAHGYAKAGRMYLPFGLRLQDQQAVEGDTRGGEGRREQLERGIDEGAPARIRRTAQRDERRQPELQFAQALTGRQDLNEAAARPAAARQDGIERCKACGQRRERRNAAPAPERGMLQQLRELRRDLGIGHRRETLRLQPHALATADDTDDDALDEQRLLLEVDLDRFEVLVFRQQPNVCHGRQILHDFRRCAKLVTPWPR